MLLTFEEVALPLSLSGLVVLLVILRQRKRGGPAVVELTLVGDVGVAVAVELHAEEIGGKTTPRCSQRTPWRGTPSFVFTFPKEDCLPCPVREHCSRAKNSRRVLTLYPQEQYEAQLQARQRQETEAFRKLYGERAGIESTLSQGIRRARIRYARYIGLARTHLQEIASAAAINFVRISNWLSGERPTETRISPFQALAAQL